MAYIGVCVGFVVLILVAPVLTLSSKSKVLAQQKSSSFFLHMPPALFLAVLRRVETPCMRVLRTGWDDALYWWIKKALGCPYTNWSGTGAVLPEEPKAGRYRSRSLLMCCGKMAGPARGRRAGHWRISPGTHTMVSRNVHETHGTQSFHATRFQRRHWLVA